MEPGALKAKAGDVTSPFFISVVVVNYNGQRHLEGCLAALAAQTYARFEIILIDNASTDGSVAYVAENFPLAAILLNAANVGFAAGNNIGIGTARGAFIATLNSDTQVERRYLEHLIAPMSDPQIGMCAPLMLEQERRELIDAAGLRVDRFGFAWNLQAGQRAERARGGKVFGACAGAALYRRALLDAIGVFDEDYFAFYEDADLAWRAHSAGWVCVLVPEARVYHRHGGSFGRISEQKLFLLARNRWWTLLKNYPTPGLWYYLPLILLADLAALVRAIVVYRSLAPLRGRIAAWRSWKRAWAKRRVPPVRAKTN